MGSMTIIFGAEEASGQTLVRGELLNDTEQLLAQENIRQHEQSRQAAAALADAKRALEAELAAVRACHTPGIDALRATWQELLSQANAAGWAVLDSIDRRLQQGVYAPAFNGQKKPRRQRTHR